MTHSFELDNTTLDQSWPVLLRQGRVALTKLCELDAASINSTALAERLQGVSRAISDIVMEQTSVEMVGHVMRKFHDPVSRKGRMFVAHPNHGHGASMGVYEVRGRQVRPRYDARIPTDYQIDELLTEEPALWSTMRVHARDYRDGNRTIIYPYDNRHYEEGAPSRYLGIVQELSRELLALTSPATARNVNHP